MDSILVLFQLKGNQICSDGKGSPEWWRLNWHLDLLLNMFTSWRANASSFFDQFGQPHRFGCRIVCATLFFPFLATTIVQPQVFQVYVMSDEDGIQNWPAFTVRQPQRQQTTTTTAAAATA